MDAIKLFVKNEKELETLIQTMRIYIQDIGTVFGVEQNAHCSNEKRETTHERRNGTTKSRKNQNALRKGNLQILEADTIKQGKMKEKM